MYHWQHKDSKQVPGRSRRSTGVTGNHEDELDSQAAPNRGQEGRAEQFAGHS